MYRSDVIATYAPVCYNKLKTCHKTHQKKKKLIELRFCDCVLQRWRCPRGITDITGRILIKQAPTKPIHPRFGKLNVNAAKRQKQENHLFIRCKSDSHDTHEPNQSTTHPICMHCARSTGFPPGIGLLLKLQRPGI